MRDLAWIKRTFILIIYAFILFPIVFIVYISFYKDQFLTFPPSGYTFHWFANALQNESLVSGFIVSFKIAALATLIGVLAGSLASVALVYYPLRGRDFFSAFLLSPLIVPGIVIGTSLYIFYIELARVSGWNPSHNLGGLVMAHTMLTIPWSARLILTNLNMLDRSVEEAARNLGAGRLATFFHITLPRMRSGIIAAALFSFVVSFGDLEVSLLLITPGNTTLPIAMIQYLEYRIDPTIAAASTIQIAIIGVLLLLTDRFVKLAKVV